jgi:predicted  nucleic acid-binding Zn-ribbon protein
MRPARSVPRRLLLAAAASVAIALTGCESAQDAANATAQDQVNQAEQAILQNQLPAATTAADAAGAVDGLSPDMAYRVHSLQGQVRLARARQLLLQAQEADLNASRLLENIRGATLRVQAIQTQLKADQGYDPAPTQAKLRAKIAQAQGADGQAGWNGNELLSISGIDAQTSQLQSAIADNRSQAQTQADKNKSLLVQADQLQQKSLGETGQPSVDDATAAAELRRQAADAAVELEKLDAALMPLQADLARVQGQRVGVQKAIDGFNQQIADLDLAWKTVQQDITRQQQAIVALAGPSTTPPAAPADQPDNLPPLPVAATTIDDECSQLKGLLADGRALGDQAAEQLRAAIKDFTGAGMAGNQLRTSLAAQLQSDRSTPAEKLAIQQIEDTDSGAAGRLAAADASQVLGADYAAQTMIAIQVRQALTAAQAALGTQAPPSVADCLASIASPSVDDLAQSAEESYKDALDQYDGLMVATMPGPAAESRKTSAMVGKMIAAFGAKELSVALENKPVAGQTPKDFQDMINDLAKSVADVDPTRLPDVPYTLPPPSATPQ